ncbi:MAG: hypothetical protein ABI639_06935 [Thermoanaerobaculia bacterium]
MTESQPMSPEVASTSNRSESGSAYLATLLILVVLTILGLSLAVITQTEVLIGGSEKQATRQVFAANSGIGLSTGFMLVAADASVHQLRIAERTQTLFGTDTTVTDDVCTSPFYQLQSGVCNLCMMNQDNDYFAVTYGVTVAALRRSDKKEVGSRKELGAVLAVEPWKNDIGGFQFSSEDRFKPMDADPTKAQDPCEGLFIKI